MYKRQIECGVVGLPAGLGDPMLDGMENRIARLAFAIPAVKGVEFGAGFGVAALRGSQNNDPFYMDGGQVKTRTNHAGGILGGITTVSYTHLSQDWERRWNTKWSHNRGCND